MSRLDWPNEGCWPTQCPIDWRIGGGDLHKAEDREVFKEAMRRIGLKTPDSGSARSRDEAARVLGTWLPAIVRPSFTMGGSGNIAHNREEFERYVDWGLAMSPVGEILVERSVIGWKEFELEVMRGTSRTMSSLCVPSKISTRWAFTGDRHCCAGHDTDGQRISGHAGCRSESFAKSGSIPEGPIFNSASIPKTGDGDHRNESSCLTEFGAGVESHRFSHRKNRCEAGGRIYAR